MRVEVLEQASTWVKMYARIKPYTKVELSTSCKRTSLLFHCKLQPRKVNNIKPCVNVSDLFCFVIYNMGPDKLECLTIAIVTGWSKIRGEGCV